MGKKKGKGKKKVVDPFALTHLEREIMHLQIETAGHKIRWRRREMRSAEGRAERLRAQLGRKTAARARTVLSLEGCIAARSSRQQQIERSIPDMERSRWEAKSRRLREVAGEVLSFTRERRAHAACAAQVREAINAEEGHDAQAAARDIAAMEAQVAAPPSSSEEGRREDFLRSEITDLFVKRMEHHQTSLRGSVDPINLKISEETRWYRDSEHLLRTERGRLRAETHARARATARAKESIARRKEATRATAAALRELRRWSSELEGRNAGLRAGVEAGFEEEAECERLRSSDAGRRLSGERAELSEGVSSLRAKEAELAALEEELQRAGAAGALLEQQKQRAEEKVREEMERSQLDMYDGPADLARELLDLLESSARDMRQQMSV